MAPAWIGRLRFWRSNVPSNSRNSFRALFRHASTRGQPSIPSVPQPTRSLIATLDGPIEPQNKSPLFAVLPPELRNRIFALVLMSYDDISQPYPGTAYYHRPGYSYRQRIDTALLSTCRRIYSEIHDLPLSQNEHVFWCSALRGPPLRFCEDPDLYFDWLTLDQRQAVVDVHLFTQLFWLENSFESVCARINAKRVKITIRHTDWWWWESNTPLMIESGWGDNLKMIEGLEVLEVELETMERDKDQLEIIVGTMNTWQFDLDEGRQLTTEGNQIVRERYLGQGSFHHSNDDYATVYDPDYNFWETIFTDANEAIQIPYVISTLRWTAK